VPGQKPAFNLDSSVEQQSHEDAKVGNKGIHERSRKVVQVQVGYTLLQLTGLAM
jgi:hypothetical protein